MSSVSRARKGRRNRAGLEPNAANTRYRLVSDFELGTTIVASIGAVARGADHSGTAPVEVVTGEGYRYVIQRLGVNAGVREASIVMPSA